MAALGTTPDDQPLAIDLDRLIGGHACIVANSGGGKSGLIRRLLETTHGRVQHIVLDVEDEFYTLRERFDYVIAGGEGGDVPATVEGAKALALGALEHGFSLIVQLNDLGADGAADFVAAFLDAMIHAPRRLWHPALVVIDEAQRFAPSGGVRTEVSRAVRALTAQGRKRGFTAILASQRIVKIDPDVRGDINNWMLGRVGQALDRNAMADQLGFSAREGRDALSGVAERSFWAFGPALCATPTLLRVADVETTPVKPGDAKILTPPAPEALQAILAGLAVAPVGVDANSGAKIIPQNIPDRELSAEIGRLRERLARTETDNANLERDRDFWRERAETRRLLLERAREALQEDAEVLAEAEKIVALMPLAAPELQPSGADTKEQARGRQVAMAPGEAASLTNSAAKMLATLAEHYPRALTLEHLTKIAGVSRTSSQWRVNRKSFESSGLVEQMKPGQWRLNSVGAARFGVEQQPDNPDAVFAYWLRQFPPATAGMLRVVRDTDEPLIREEIAARAGISLTSSGLGSGLRELVNHGLIVLRDGRYVIGEALL